MTDNRLQFIAIAGSIALLFLIIFLIRQNRLKERYSLLWLFVIFIFIVASIWKGALEWVSDIIGIAYPPAALFLILIISLFGIMVEFSLIISRQSKWIEAMGQNIGLMKLEIKELKQKVNSKTQKDT